MTRSPSDDDETTHAGDGDETTRAGDGDETTHAGDGQTRRGLLRAVGFVAAGGVAAALLTERDTGETGIVEVNARHGVVPDRERSAGRTVVSFDEEHTRVQLVGRLGHGSTRCERIGVRTAAYDAETDRLRVVVAPVERESRPRACTTPLDRSWYRVRVRFASSLPAVVRVVERGPGEESRNRTVRRRRQRRRCRRESYDNESVAATAHWTCPERYVSVGDDNATQ